MEKHNVHMILVLKMRILGEEEVQYIKEKYFNRLVDDIPILYFTSQDCKLCDTVEQLLQDISEISNQKLKLKIMELQKIHMDILGVKRGPILLIGKYGEIRYTGAPIGEESWAFLEGIALASNRRHGLEEYENDLSSLDRKVKIETIVTPNCPWCPHACLEAHKVAVASRGKVISDVVEAYEFPEIAEKYNVSAVPTIVLSVNGNYNGKVFMVGVPKLKDLIRGVMALGIED